MTEMTQQQMTMQSVPGEDKASKTRTIYDVGVGEIIWRNMLAGFSRALGGLLIYGIFLGFSLYLFSAFVMPTLQPLFSAYIQGMNSIQQLNKMTSPASYGINPSQNPTLNQNTAPNNNGQNGNGQNGQSLQDLLKQLQSGQ